MKFFPAGKRSDIMTRQGGLIILIFLAMLAGCKAEGSPGSSASPAGQGGPTATPGNPGAASGQGRGRGAVISVQIANAQYGSLQADHQTAGTIQAVTPSNVSAQTSGVVARLIHRVGDWVDADETIIKLDDTTLTLTARNAQAVLDNAKLNLASASDTTTQAGPRLELQVQSAQRALDSAEKSYASAKAIYELGGISGSDLDNAAGQVSTAQANLATAKTNLDQNGKSGSQNLAQLQIAVDQANIQLQQAQLNLQFTNVKAPFAGQIAAINVSPGQFISTSVAAFTLVSAARQIAFNATPTEAARLVQGSALYFLYNGQAWPARISQAPSAPINGVVPMTARLNGNLDLPYGTVGTVSFSLSLAKGVIIPVTALQANEKQYFVFVVQGGKAQQQTITIIDQSGDNVAVAGLPANSQVILNAPPGLLPGSSVQALGSQTPAPSSSAATGQAGQGNGSPKRQRPAASATPGAANPAVQP